MTTEKELKTDPLLRREAGEGWREQGIDPQLLKIIVAREVAADKITTLSGLDKHESQEMDAYLIAAEAVKLYRERNEISDPPPLPPEDD